MYFRKILVGLDLEVRDIQSEEIIPELTRKVFDRALKMAIAQRGQLKLCAAVEGLDLTHVPASPMQVNALTGYLVERLEVLQEEARAAGVECESDLLGGVASAELTREANDFDADLLIVGGGVSPDRFGSTAMKVLRNATCPVLIERSHDPKIKVTSQPTNEMSAAISSASSDDGVEEPQHVLIADDLSDVCRERALARCEMLVGPCGRTNSLARSVEIRTPGSGSRTASSRSNRISQASVVSTPQHHRSPHDDLRHPPACA